MRIPDESIERLKREVSVERLAEGRGIKLRRHGQDLLGLCPFHDDHEPSLVVSPKTNLWNCLGACKKGGSSIDWVMKSNGVSFRHAVELMLEDLPAAMTAPARAVKVSTVRRLPSPLERDAEDRDLLRQVVSFYHESLKQSAKALAYLEERGLRSAEMIDRFQLGFSDRTLGYRIPEKSREEGEVLRTRLQKLGLLRESGHEHFRGSLVVPVLDESGDVAELYGRKITPNLRKGTPLHLYLPGPHRGVFNVEALAASKEVILCEALLDALTFWSAGLRNVTASYGASGFTADHLEAFKRHGTETVVIAYDRDEAGDKGAEAVAAQLVPLGIGCFRVQFPHGMDANEYAMRVKPAEQALDVLVRGAVWMGGPATRPARASLLVAAAKGKAIGEAGAERPRAALPAAPPARSAERSETPDPVPVPAKEADLRERKTGPESGPEGTSTPVAAVGEAAGTGELVVRIEDRSYRVRSLPDLLTYDHLFVNVYVSRELGDGETGIHVERLDLYARLHRVGFAKEAASELRLEEEVIRRELGQVLRQVEEEVERRKKKRAEELPKTVEMSEKDRDAALELLRAPDLLGRILEDFERAGVVGEEANKLMGYLATVSRKLEEPLALLVQSSSAAGKSSLMEAVLAFVPEEDRIKYSAMTGQSLYYLGESDLKHKVLAIVEEEGAEKASYALKLLQSEGELTIASTGKDPETGKLVTQDYRVEGPVMIFLTTTASEIDEELVNRCVVLTVDEEREQTQAIHRLQRENQTLEGLRARVTRDRVRALHRNAQRLLRPLEVVNPYARELTFLDDRTRTRRDHMKYLTLIRTIAFLNQHQRELKTREEEGELVEYVEVTLEDIAVANRLACEVLGRSLDALAPQTKRLLVFLDGMVRERAAGRKCTRSAVRFSRREVREKTGLSLEQVRVHLGRLVEHEYLVVHHGANGIRFEYELAYDGRGLDGRPFLAGLLDVAKLAGDNEYDANLPGLKGHLPEWKPDLQVTYRPPTGELPATYRPSRNGDSPHEVAPLSMLPVRDPKNAH